MPDCTLPTQKVVAQDILDRHLRTVFPIGGAHDLDVLAATPVIEGPMTVAYRVVLYRLGDVFVVHSECFPDFPNLENSYLHAGSYYRLSCLPEALDKFAEKVGNLANDVHCIYSRLDRDTEGGAEWD